LLQKRCFVTFLGVFVTLYTISCGAHYILYRRNSCFKIRVGQGSATRKTERASPFPTNSATVCVYLSGGCGNPPLHLHTQIRCCKNAYRINKKRTEDSVRLFHKLKFCEIFDCSNHLAGVGVFVVIPGNNLYLIEVICNLCNHCLCCIE